MRSGPLLLLVMAASMAACGRRPPTAAGPVRYVVGAGYQTGGVWYYPREDFHYDATGLATVNPANRAVTTDGEIADPTALTASHQTLQLPAIARVTNLETGLQLLVRVNDRGPPTPNRIIGLSPRAAERLGVADGVARVRVQVEEGPSAALREQLQGGPILAVSAAPRAAVQSETLAPPPGIGQSIRGRNAGVTPTASETAPPTAERIPDRLPETVQRVMTNPGSLVITAGSFGAPAYANQVAARLARIGGRVERVHEGRTNRYRVLAGPFPTVTAADTALDQALRAGVSDARIVIE